MLKALMLVLFVATIPLYGATTNNTCSWLWGQGKVNDSNGKACGFEVGNGPALYSVQLPGTFSVKNILQFEFKVSGGQLPNALELRFPLAKQPKKWASYEFPFYKDHDFNWIQLDTWTKVTLSHSQLNWKEQRADLGRRVQVYSDLKSSPLKIEFRNIGLRAKKNPKGFVSLTFDDGFSSVYPAAQLMKAKGLVGTVYVIKNAVGKKGYMSKEQICKLASWGWMIGYHHETPLGQFNSLSKQIPKDQKAVQGLCAKTSVEHIAYPLGKQNKGLRSEIQPFFKTGRLASGGIETLPPADPMAMRAINVLPKLGASALLGKVKKAIDGGDYGIFMFHRFRDQPRSDLEYSWKEFKAFLTGLEPYTKSIKTVEQVSGSSF